MQPTPHTLPPALQSSRPQYDRTGRAPNNRKDNPHSAPNLVWSDVRLLAAALDAAPLPVIEQNTASRVRSMTSLFQEFGLEPPTVSALTQWLRRDTIPDRWRPDLLWMLLSKKTMPLGTAFSRAKKTPTPTAPGTGTPAQ